MTKRSDVIAGMRFTRLVTIEPVMKGRQLHWRCVCDCGKERVAYISDLIRGQNHSCGCLHREISAARMRILRTSHGHAKGWAETRTYTSWQSMMSRCNNPKASDYARYGGRGISVCDRWRSFEAFLADMGERPADKTLDRRDVHGDYEPENCRWATVSEQNSNKRSRFTSIEPHEVEQIKWLYSIGYRQNEIATFFEVSQTYISGIVRGRIHGVIR